MTITVAILQNILNFMDRVDCKGQEALAWAEVNAAVKAEIQLLTPLGVKDAVKTALKGEKK